MQHLFLEALIVEALCITSHVFIVELHPYTSYRFVCIGITMYFCLGASVPTGRSMTGFAGLVSSRATSGVGIALSVSARYLALKVALISGPSTLAWIELVESPVSSDVASI